MFQIRTLSNVAAQAALPALTEILTACVAGGASVGFMAPLTHDRATAFWMRIASDVAAGERILLVAEDAAGIVGTVQLVLAQPENQPHRGDVAKMLVHPRGREQGIGAGLINAVCDAARAAGKTLLVLDTVTDSAAARLYTRTGWQRVGEIPDFALWPAGGLCATTFFYKRV